MADDDSSSSSSSTGSSKQYAEPPDGGYGWIITFASFMCHFIIDGMAFTFGVIYPHLVDEFESSRSATSWIGSLFIGIPLICGPIAGMFLNRYGCRITTIFGGLITSAGLFASAFVSSVEMMSLTYGVVAGFGLAFVYVPASVIPSFWFEKKRSLATGIAVSGSGVGTFAMAPLMDYLMDTYTWRGALIIASGITMNLLVFGSLFKDVPDHIKPKSVPSSTPTLVVASDSSERIGSQVKPDKSLSSKASSPIRLFSSEELLPTSPTSDATPLFVNTSVNTRIVGEQLNIDYPQRRRSGRTVDVVLSGIPLNQTFRSNRSLLPLSRHDISSVLQLAERQRYTSSCPQLSITEHDADVQQVLENSQAKRFGHKILKLGQEMCDIRLFAVPVYLVFFVSNFLLSAAYDVPYVYLPDYAKEHNIVGSSLLVSIIGIVNMVGQILYGFLGDKRRINTLTLYGVSMLLCGLLVSVTPLFMSYWPLAVTYSFFGLLISANYSLETIVVIKILSLNQLTKAYSLLMFGQGVAALIGPPIGGALWDLTQTYTYTFVFSGVCFTLSALLVLTINCMKTKDARSRGTSISSTNQDVEDPLN